jgi:predicted aspartyl protease
MRPLRTSDSLSRRCFVGFGAATALFTGAGAAQTLGQIQPGTPAAEEAARIAARTDLAAHMTIPVQINGHGPYRFVVDTGADRSVIAVDIAEAIGLVPHGDVTVQGVVRSISSQMVPVGELRFGSLIRRNLTLPLLPRALMGADGYLGLDAVDGARVTLDFENHVLKVTPPRHRSRLVLQDPREAYVPVGGERGHLRALNCSVDGIATICFLDTGAEISVGNGKLLEAMQDNAPTRRPLGMVPITGVTGGVINATVTDTRLIRLHGINFTNATIAIADMQIFEVWGLTHSPALLIGMNFLRQFSQVSIDYGMKEIQFDLASMRIAGVV